jgi:hypothetical protein
MALSNNIYFCYFRRSSSTAMVSSDQAVRQSTNTFHVCYFFTTIVLLEKHPTVKIIQKLSKILLVFFSDKVSNEVIVMLMN